MKKLRYALPILLAVFMLLYTDSQKAEAYSARPVLCGISVGFKIPYVTLRGTESIIVSALTPISSNNPNPYEQKLYRIPCRGVFGCISTFEVGGRHNWRYIGVEIMIGKFHPLRMPECVNDAGLVYGGSGLEVPDRDSVLAWSQEPSLLPDDRAILLHLADHPQDWTFDLQAIPVESYASVPAVPEGVAPLDQPTGVGALPHLPSICCATSPISIRRRITKRSRLAA